MYDPLPRDYYCTPSKHLFKPQAALAEGMGGVHTSGIAGAHVFATGTDFTGDDERHRDRAIAIGRQKHWHQFWKQGCIYSLQNLKIEPTQ